jgi:uncharacterized protein (DUF1778 family)
MIAARIDMDGASEKTRAPRHDAVINVRLPVKTRELIDSAAALVGKTRTEFVLESARQHAADVLADQRLLSLDETSYSAFLDVLDNPPAPSEQLKALLATSAPWEK